MAKPKKSGNFVIFCHGKPGIVREFHFENRVDTLWKALTIIYPLFEAFIEVLSFKWTSKHYFSFNTK